MLICCVTLPVCAFVIDTGVETTVVVVAGTTGRNCHEVYARGSPAAAQEELTEAFANPSGASASNSWSKDLVMAGEAGMVVTTGLVTSNGLLVITAWFGAVDVF
ncbi:hypothetical protein Hanom_Chr13g01227901 [Helianthus anomalus]